VSGIDVLEHLASDGSELLDGVCDTSHVGVLGQGAFSQIHVGGKVGEGIGLDDGDDGLAGVLFEDGDDGVNVLASVSLETGSAGGIGASQLTI